MNEKSKLGLLFTISLTGCTESLFDGQTDSVLPVSEEYNGYYDDVIDSYRASDYSSASEALRLALHERIENHDRLPYTDNDSTDTWDVLEVAQRVEQSPGKVLDIYRDSTYEIKTEDREYNREHSWPKSYGFPHLEAANAAYTDMHALFISDAGYNSSRNNRPYRNCGEDCREKPTAGGDANRVGVKAWETWSGRRGDVARAIFYMDVRYEGGTHSETGNWEPDLVVTDNLTQIADSSTGANEAKAYMGLRHVLLEWHQEDPVDEREQRHNETVAEFQNNRNPFVDHPEWVECVFMNYC